MDENKSHAEKYDFQHGYTSGLESVDKNNYEGYLSSQVNFEWLDKQLQEQKQELNKLEEKITQAKSAYKSAFDALQDRVLKVGLAGKNKERLESELFEIDEKKHQLEKRRLTAVHKYSLFAGIIYFIAGVSFVAGDLIISHEIVAYALNIHNTVEAWSFAVGLAMVSILLKPAYERLIESPYSDGESAKAKKTYAWFKGVTVVFAVITLFVLGWFRYEAYKTDKMKEGINKAIKNLNNQVFDPLNPTAPPPPAVQAQIEAKMRSFDALNQDLVNSPWALASFVLSGVLFALAGAICLGIAFPVLQCYWYRWLQIDPQLKRLNKQRNSLLPQIKAEDEALAEHLIQKNILENDLQLVDDFQALEKERANLSQEIKEIHEGMRLSETDARIASYNDGFGKGSMVRDAINDEELSQFVRESYFTTSNLASKAKSSSPEKALFSRKPQLRPHQQLRKLISEDFDSSEEL
ncbi:hypothetical protein [Flectobacillus longus]|uniref:hypothetical protein n=1 Tax=Flectobacillus longus TaxID=2984207 RepID=UPI0024B82B09|nr:hypothetical protein [Flectobacillus longus]MDI9878697.1 hypothetical protein [Flectobacillus longus]